MLIIWGFRETNKEMGPVDYLHCNRCNNDGIWRLQREISWFTLFFIPIIPYRFKYYVYCPVCHWITEVPRSEAQRIIEKNKAQPVTAR